MIYFGKRDSWEAFNVRLGIHFELISGHRFMVTLVLPSRKKVHNSPNDRCWHIGPGRKVLAFHVSHSVYTTPADDCLRIPVPMCDEETYDLVSGVIECYE